MRRRTHTAVAAICLLAAVGSGCRNAAPAGTPNEPRYVLLTHLLGTTALYHGQTVRVAGWCRIEFEATALYVDRETMETTYGGPAMWLSIWPPSDEVRKLDHKFVLVEATVDADERGHYRAYRGTLKDVRSIRETTVERERDAMLRAMGAPR
jgi:hypothetical protein